MTEAEFLALDLDGPVDLGAALDAVVVYLDRQAKVKVKVKVKVKAKSKAKDEEAESQPKPHRRAA